jgi:starch phosphorylase
MTADFRGDFIFQDAERLAAILTARRRPVQIVFAGRAHPEDDAGRRLIREIFARAVDATFGGRIAFLEDYDLHAARLIVQGCDAWVTPPSLSGQLSLGALKAGINGVPHVELPAGTSAAAAARALYHQLEDDIVPAFYARDRRGLPLDWAARVRETMRRAIPRASARTAVKAALERLYNRTAPHV